ncbi:hypothetical protein A9Q84_18720 [Halobacteriovorax marinus]|uniref:Cytochrome c domain-containing protein n=1 Tax=Halobacteriovorax marinus TaxID=97084 RepID=A0A1Y5F7I0_9BACT|nr:hypothetical protein A9Q84_18720 [Halobacteriovorax marinus]
MNIINVFNILYSLLSFLGGSTLSEAVLFESLESKTEIGKEVYNVIQLKVGSTKDVWTMKQSHHGVHSKVWDQIKIIVHKEEKPYKASYHQLSNGKEIDYKVSCFRCHSGGPRLVRPNYDSKMAKLSLEKQLTILKWNLLIKSYGEVQIKGNNSIKRKIELITDIKSFKKELAVNSCSKCHYQGGPRAVLTKANTETMKFLVKNKAMPPWPYELTKKDKKDLNKFIHGF